jgi:predicted DNA-binding transcriptional regulator YafY
MNTEGRSVRWGVERRLEFIEFRLFWEGGVNRADLIDAFGISVPQASKDLSLYQEQAPGNVEYDKRAKRYVASERFKPLFLDSDPDAYFSRLRAIADGSAADSGASWLANPPGVDVALTPRREVDRQVLRAVLAAIRDGQSVEILYQSMNKASPDPSWRRITPHAMGYDGLRWHVRAFSHDEDRFRDFLLPRALQFRAPGAPGASAEDDRLWHQQFKLEIAPHPGLTASQKKVVAKDFGMAGGKGIISVRHAMLFYVLKRLNLLNDPEKEDPRQQHIVVVNKDEVRQALDLTDTPQARSRSSAGTPKAG